MCKRGRGMRGRGREREHIEMSEKRDMRKKTWTRLSTLILFLSPHLLFHYLLLDLIDFLERERVQPIYMLEEILLVSRRVTER